MKRAAFTLVELLMGTSIVVLLLGSAYLSLAAGFKSRELVEERSMVMQQARVALQLLAQDLRVATPLAQERPFLGIRRKLDQANFDNLDFATHRFAPVRPGEGDLCEVSYFVDRAQVDGPRCLFRRRDPRMDSEPLTGGSRELIVTGVTHFEVEYYDGFDWVDEWGEREIQAARDMLLANETTPETGEEEASGGTFRSGLPDAVRIRIGLCPASAFEGGHLKTGVRPLVYSTVVRLELSHRPQSWSSAESELGLTAVDDVMSEGEGGAPDAGN